MLESEDLRSDKHEEQLDLISFAVGDVVRPAKRYTDEKAQSYRDIVLRLCETIQDYEDDVSHTFVCFCFSSRINISKFYVLLRKGN